MSCEGHGALRSPDGSTEQTAAAAFQALAEHIRDVSGRGYVCVGESRKLAGLVLATVHGLINLERDGQMPHNTETSAPEKIVELLFALITRL